MNKTILTYNNQLEFKKFAFKNGLKRKCDFYFDDVDCVDAKTSSNIPKVKCDGTLTYEKALKKLIKYFENMEKFEAKEAEREAKAAAKAKRDAKRAKEIEKRRKKAESKKAKREAKKMKDAIRKEKERAKKQALKEKKMQKKANAKVKPIASANSNISEKDLLKLVKQYVNNKVTGIVECIKYRNDLDALANKLNKNNKFFSVNATDNDDGTTTVSVRFTDVVKAKTKKFKRNESTNDIVVEPIAEVDQPTENEVAPENDMNITIETENTNEVIADEVSMPNQPTENDMIADDDGDELIDEDIDVRDPDEIADEINDEENADDEDDDFEEEDDRRFDDETDEDKVDYRREYYEDDDMLADFEQ